MGADLYLMSQFERRHERWSKRFDKAIRRRDRSKDDTPERDDAQKEAERCFEEMYSTGYFRDPYNPASVLWMFGLSWWEDVAKLLDKQGRLTPKKARELLALLKDREPAFQANLSRLRKRERRYYEERYAAFQAFLKEAIYRNEPIACSI